MWFSNGLYFLAVSHVTAFLAECQLLSINVGLSALSYARTVQIWFCNGLNFLSVSHVTAFLAECQLLSINVGLSALSYARMTVWISINRDDFSLSDHWKPWSSKFKPSIILPSWSILQRVVSGRANRRSLRPSSFAIMLLRQPGDHPFGTPDLWAEFNAYFDPVNYYYEPKDGDSEEMGKYLSFCVHVWFCFKPAASVSIDWLGWRKYKGDCSSAKLSLKPKA